MKRTVPILLAVLIVVLTGCSQSDYRAAVSAYEKRTTKPQFPFSTD